MGHSTVICARKAEPIEMMPFGMWTRVGPRNHVLCRGLDSPLPGKGKFRPPLRRGLLSECLITCCASPAVGYTMDVMYFAWLPNSVEIDKAIQLPQFRLRRTVQHDCSQNYTGGTVYSRPAANKFIGVSAAIGVQNRESHLTSWKLAANTPLRP